MDVGEIQTADIDIEIMLQSGFCEQIFQRIECCECCRVIFGIVVVVAEIVEKIYLHVQRQLVYIRVYRFIASEGGIEILQILVDAAESHIQAEVALFRQLQRIAQKQSPAVPLCCFRHLAQLHVAVAYVGANIRKAAFLIAVLKHLVCFGIESYRFVWITLHLVPEIPFGVVQYAEHTFHTCRLWLRLQKFYYAIPLYCGGVRECKRYLSAHQPQIVVIVFQAVGRGIQTGLYHFFGRG